MTDTLTSSRPPFDPELEAALSALAGMIPPTITREMIAPMREAPMLSVTEEILLEAGIEARDVTIPGHEGDEIVVTVLQSIGRTGTGPGIYHTHGGGMIIGDRWTGAAALFDWIVQYNAVAVSVEYRLAPEFPDPYPVEDCYAGLVWTAENAASLGIDPDRLLIVGGSAGGGLAAGVALLARDRSGPALCGQLLMYPMIDDRDETVSTVQIDGVGVWDRGSNVTGWDALLGDRRGTDAVSIYAAPARARDLSGLPPAFIDCGSAEVFRDEDVAYASTIWACGGEAELHVWPGGFHAFEGFAPQAALSRAMIAARNDWVRRILGS
ncbi:acetyl esterase/lipase [Microterricola gilva]|uniref:Acetyl esterase/lipase n=1 Tax=Microterricola gilva TaxID=393267 RepID=A0A4Q8ANN3_9MICO|nr:alpha/beta hydrolase [Microterricola gilva]RZU65595.1 acetyl esterase/lipase [Microterricola gilva]